MSLNVGILGFGYLGKELKEVLETHTDVWVTRQHATDQAGKQDSSSQVVTFRWTDPKTWSNLPDDNSILIVTIPPTNQNITEEKQHVVNWCDWMRHNRSHINRCVYISSTGVYPNQPGVWKESSRFECDSLKGKLRLLTETAMADHFDTVIIRPGAIYGKERNIGHRILAGKPVPKGEQPVHRIHVHDLARLVDRAITSDNFPNVINAIDLESETTKNVADWLINQPYFPAAQDVAIEYRTDFQTRKFNLTQPDRKICNQLLVEMGFTLRFPSYKEGLAHAFG